jgi:hypothetical protein
LFRNIRKQLVKFNVLAIVDLDEEALLNDNKVSVGWKIHKDPKTGQVEWKVSNLQKIDSTSYLVYGSYCL